MPEDTGDQDGEVGQTKQRDNESATYNVLLAYADAMLHHFNLTVFKIPSDGEIEEARIEEVEEQDLVEEDKSARELDNNSDLVKD